MASAALECSHENLCGLQTPTIGPYGQQAASTFKGPPINPRASARPRAQRWDWLALMNGFLPSWTRARACSQEDYSGRQARRGRDRATGSQPPDPRRPHRRPALSMASQRCRATSRGGLKNWVCVAWVRAKSRSGRHVISAATSRQCAERQALETAQTFRRLTASSGCKYRQRRVSCGSLSSRSSSSSSFRKGTVRDVSSSASQSCPISCIRQSPREDCLPEHC
ncbi:hypothetical protein LX36DRAFT_182640 [Colletotrichum falcatum]|nr:hypothetical protein LX36DRAFT_182640 [Colletotrichum falcatum]